MEKGALFSIQQLSSDISVQYRHTILFTTGLNIFCAVHATSLLFFSVFLKNSKNSSGFLIFQWKRNSICYILYNNSFVLNIVLFLISSISYALCYCPTRVSCCMETSCCTAEGDGAVFRVESGDFYTILLALIGFSSHEECNYSSSHQNGYGAMIRYISAYFVIEE